MPLLGDIRKLVGRRQRVSRRLTRIVFNVKISESFRTLNIPSQLKNLLVYIAREGVAVTDLFRRPGGSQDIKRIIADLESGRPVNWTDYNFYTLANIAKRYLLHIDGGILGSDNEELMLSVLELHDDEARIEALHGIIVSQPKPVQQLIALLFGIWFRMIYHTEVNAMSVEAVAKSVAGSIFPSCTTCPQKVERASKVMEYLITGFASPNLFSHEMIEYFTSETKTSISRVEKFKYEFRFPRDVPREKSVRLFMRMLLEEGRKHGFHLIHDAVSKELFENTNWSNLCTFGVEASVVNPIDGGNNSSEENWNNPIEQDRHTRSSTAAPICTQSSENTDRRSWHGDRWLKTKTSTTTSGGSPSFPHQVVNNTLPSHSNSYESYTNDRPPLDDPVQQLSEKRTCVTTKPISSTLDDNPFNDDSVLGDQRQTEFIDCTTKLRNPSLPSPLRARYGIECKANVKSLVRPVTFAEPACFSSVKRRQLERLQKRTDWFLSPPSGLRSSGDLIHISPKPHMPPTDINDTGVGVIPMIEPSSQSSGSSTLHDIHHITYDELDQELDQLNEWDMTDPARLWSTSRGAPAATSSPVRNLIWNSCNDQSFCVSGVDEKENYPEIETRYYVVERYYGPEPRPSISRRFRQHINLLRRSSDHITTVDS